MSGNSFFKKYSIQIIYFLIFILNIFTIALSFYFSNQLYHSYSRSVEVNKTWVAHRDQILILRNLGVAINAPGNDIFDSLNTALERGRLKKSSAEFDVFMQSFEQKIIADVSGNDRVLVKKFISEIHTHKNAMVVVTEKILDLFNQNQTAEAAKYMAEMDRQFTALAANFSDLAKEISSIQQRIFENNLQEIVKLQKFAQLIISILTLFFILSIYYGFNIQMSLNSGRIENAKLLEVVSRNLQAVNNWQSTLDQYYILAITDLAGKITYVNERFCEISKYSREQLLGQDHQIINSRYHPKEFFRDLWATIQAGKVWQGEIRNKAKDGSFYWVHSTIVPFLNEKGEPFQYVAIRTDITERKKQEEKILQLSRAVENSPASIVITDITGTIEYVNPRFVEVTGYSVLEAIGQNPRVLKSGEQTLEFYRAMWNTIKQGHLWRGEFHNKKKNGELYWESASISPLKDARGRITHYIAVKEDITQRKLNEEAIKILSSYQKTLLDNAGYSIISTDAKGIIKVFNPAAQRMLGYKSEEVIEKLTPEIIHDKNEVIARAKEFSQEMNLDIKPGFDVFIVKSQYNLPNTYEWTYIRKDGSRFPVLLTVSALRDEKGNIFGYLGVASDISNIKNTQKNLELVTQRFELARKSAKIGVWDWDVVNNIKIWDEQMFSIYGLGQSDINDTIAAWRSIVHPQDLPRIDKELEDALSGKKDYDTEYRICWPDGSLHYIRAFGAVSRDPQGKALRITGINWDITAQREAEFKVVEAVRVKSEFTSMVSHELRTPLTVIKESVAIVHDGTAGPLNSDQKDFLDAAKRNVDRLGRLINDVLDYQKLEAQKTEFNMVEQNINDLISEVGKSFQLPLKNKGLGLVFQLQGDLPPITFDRDQITQVLTNFINNAMKFTQKGNVILISEKNGDNAIRVSVKDQGIGIKQDDFHKLFQSFSQISTGMGRQTGGTGLGLTLCKKIVESHKGKVGVESVFGEGSTFYFILPLHDRRGR